MRLQTWRRTRSCLDKAETDGRVQWSGTVCHCLTFQCFLSDIAFVAQCTACHVTRSRSRLFIGNSKKRSAWQARASTLYTPPCHSPFTFLYSTNGQLFLLWVRNGRPFRVGCGPRRGSRANWRSGCVRGLVWALGLHHVHSIC
jgi:hypothetical protein